MKSEDFDKIVEQCTKIIIDSLKSKGEEYAQDNEDRLANFKRAADIEQTIPEKALIDYWVKHVVSILDIVDRLERENKKTNERPFSLTPEFITKELIDEKIKDLVNYPIILKTILYERYGWK